MTERYQLWGGCFNEAPSEVLRRLNDSLRVDSRLFREDIRGSKAWAQELFKSKHLTKEDHDAIQSGLDKVKEDIEKELNEHGCLKDPEEDIHSVVERRLQAYAGDAALRLHTGRSRNDQSATDTRLWLLDARSKLRCILIDLITVLVRRAEKEILIIAPGYTHLQRAQPIRWSHFLLSHAFPLKDDVIRLDEQESRLSRCPLGSGALAGCAFTIDRVRLAQDLGFHDVTHNSLTAVGSRDYIVEFLNWATLCSVHLSRLAEDLIIYSSREFGLVRLSDQFSTGSSLMPQKRNPDGLELVRSSAGVLLGNSTAWSCILKGLPTPYNKDLQYDKELLFSTFDRLTDCLKVMIGTVQTMEVNADKMSQSLEPEMLATDLAHALVRRGVPFRRAHHHVGAVLRRAGELEVTLDKLPHKEYLAICPEFGSEADVQAVFSWEASVEQYTSAGGTSRSSVRHQIENLLGWLDNDTRKK